MNLPLLAIGVVALAFVAVLYYSVFKLSEE